MSGELQTNVNTTSDDRGLFKNKIYCKNCDFNFQYLNMLCWLGKNNLVRCLSYLENCIDWDKYVFTFYTSSESCPQSNLYVLFVCFNIATQLFIFPWQLFWVMFLISRVIKLKISAVFVVLLYNSPCCAVQNLSFYSFILFILL